MSENIENNGTEKKLRIVFEKRNKECEELCYSINSIEFKITDIKNKILHFKDSINNSKKMDKILYTIIGIIIGGTTFVGLLSASGFSSLLIGIGTISLSIPLTCLIQTAIYRLHVGKIISELNNELCTYRDSLKEEKIKLLDKKNEIANNSHEHVQDKLDKNDEHIDFHFENKLKKYQKPYIKVKKINN